MSQIRLHPSFAYYKIHKAANVFACSSRGIEIVWTSERISSIPDRCPRWANRQRMFIFSDLQELGPGRRAGEWVPHSGVSYGACCFCNLFHYLREVRQCNCAFGNGNSAEDVVLHKQ